MRLFRGKSKSERKSSSAGSEQSFSATYLSRKMLEELQERKEGFRKKFELFNEGSEEAQKKAID